MRTMMNLALVASAALAVAAPTGTDPSIQISVDATTPGPAIPADFAGLSYERNKLLPAADGSRYFRADNTPLLSLFRTLGLRSLRIGGNTSDRDAGPPPSDEDLDHLFAFAKAADIKVIYSLRLHNGDPAENARLVRRILDRHADQLDYFSIGQEPSPYPVKKIDDRPATERMGAGTEHFQYEDFRDLWRQHHAAIAALAPEARFAGPAVHSHAEWTRRFTEDFGKNHGGYEIRPLAYALAAFTLAGPGRPLPVKLDGTAADIHVHARIADNGNVSITLINLGHGSGASTRKFSLPMPHGKSARLARLLIPKGDVSATSGITLGGTPIAADGSWAGSWESLEPDAQACLQIALPPASAAVLQIEQLSPP